MEVVGPTSWRRRLWWCHARPEIGSLVAPNVCENVYARIRANPIRLFTAQNSEKRTLSFGKSRTRQGSRSAFVFGRRDIQSERRKTHREWAPKRSASGKRKRGARRYPVRNIVRPSRKSSGVLFWRRSRRQKTVSRTRSNNDIYIPEYIRTDSAPSTGKCVR